MPDDDFIKIKKRDLTRLFLLLIFFAAGFFLNSFISAQPKTQVSMCNQFCDYANLDFAFVKDGMCYCYQGQIFYNQVQNKTVTVYQAINVGLIKNITAEDGLTQQARNLLTGG